MAIVFSYDDQVAFRFPWPLSSSDPNAWVSPCEDGKMKTDAAEILDFVSSSDEDWTTSSAKCASLAFQSAAHVPQKQEQIDPSSNFEGCELRGGRDASIFEMDTPSPVSYTHLTLPTICSV
eukprot:1261630-Rhodomonas_salina.2